jgi:hypothetical protein
MPRWQERGFIILELCLGLSKGVVKVAQIARKRFLANV